MSGQRLWDIGVKIPKIKEDEIHWLTVDFSENNIEDADSIVMKYRK